jgi:predicted nucleic acid-binding protein
MEIFFDTNVLVAASAKTHVHFARAAPAVDRVIAGKDKGFLSLHSVAEVFSTLTRMPVQPRIHAAEAARILTDDLLGHFEAIPLTKEDYVAVLETMVSGSWRGGKIYDALLLRCAEKSGAERIYTFNLADFQQMASPALRAKICAP